jgi:hypothetical protein
MSGRHTWSSGLPTPGTRQGSTVVLEAALLVPVAVAGAVLSVRHVAAANANAHRRVARGRQRGTPALSRVRSQGETAGQRRRERVRVTADRGRNQLVVLDRLHMTMPTGL